MMNLTKKQYTQSDKILMSVCVVASVVVVYAFANFKPTKVKLTKNEASQINYEMAKLQNAESLYSLENREVEMDYKALEAKKTAAKVEVKKVADKTKKATAPVAQAVAKNVMAQQAAEARRKALVASQKQRMQARSAVKPAQETSAKTETDSKQNTNAAQDQYKPVDNTVATDAPAADKKSFAQWRSEIFAAQNKEVIMKLVAALKKGEVTQEDYQRLVSEMVASKDDKMVGLALYALRSAPSYSSYVQFVKLQGNVSATYTAYVEQSLMAYNQTANLGFLKQSLSSKDKQVVMKTLEIIKTGVTGIKAGDVAGMMDPRNVRDLSSAQLSLTNYLSFIPLLQQLAGSNDQEIVALASQNITLIDDPQYIAAN
jgi:hypothetical protein